MKSLFLMFALLRRASFWPPSMAFISVINYTYYKLQFFFHDIDHLWAASIVPWRVYCYSYLTCTLMHFTYLWEPIYLYCSYYFIIFI
jgi:hypothetical protein